EQPAASGRFSGGQAPELLRHKRSEWMQKLQDLVTHPGVVRAVFYCRQAAGPLQHRLRQFEIPVAEDVPDKAICRPGCLIETISLNSFGDLAHGLRGFVRAPARARLVAA